MVRIERKLQQCSFVIAKWFLNCTINHFTKHEEERQNDFCCSVRIWYQETIYYRTIKDNWKFQPHSSSKWEWIKHVYLYFLFLRNKIQTKCLRFTNAVLRNPNDLDLIGWCFSTSCWRYIMKYVNLSAAGRICRLLKLAEVSSGMHKVAPRVCLAVICDCVSSPPLPLHSALSSALRRRDGPGTHIWNYNLLVNACVCTNHGLFLRNYGAVSCLLPLALQIALFASCLRV